MKNLGYVALIIAVFVLGMCVAGDKEEPGIDPIDRAYEDISDFRDSLMDSYKPKYDSLIRLASSYDSIANRAMGRSKDLEETLRWARGRRDTVRIIQYQDSIIVVKDTVIRELFISGKVKDSLINIQHNLITELDSVNMVKDTMYRELSDKYGVVDRKRAKFKRQRNGALIAVVGFIIFEVSRTIIK